MDEPKVAPALTPEDMLKMPHSLNEPPGSEVLPPDEIPPPGESSGEGGETPEGPEPEPPIEPPPEPDPLPDEAELAAMTRAELNEMAIERGLDPSTCATKADVIAMMFDAEE